MRSIWALILFLTLGMALLGYFYFTRERSYSGKKGEVVELNFQLDKQFEFGEYYFDLDNGKRATYQLCFCLAKGNMYPPDCIGNVAYIYNNYPGKMCVPLHIGTGACGTTRIESLSYATKLFIPLEYAWTKPFESIIMGIKIPEEAPENSLLSVQVKVFKMSNSGKPVEYRNYEKNIAVK